MILQSFSYGVWGKLRMIKLDRGVTVIDELRTINELRVIENLSVVNDLKVTQICFAFVATIL